MKTVFTLILTLFALSAFSQQNWVPVTYTTLQGEKVEAYINDRNWSQNPTFILVSDNPKGLNPNKLDTKLVKSFKVSEGDWFESYSLLIDRSPYLINKIELNAEPNIVRESVFLRILVKGDLNLLYLKDNDEKEHFFIQKGNELPEELIFNRLKREINGHVVLLKEEVYKDKLERYMSGCNPTKTKVKHTRYDKMSLQRLFIAYNTCNSGSETSFAATEDRLEIYNSLVTGGFYTTMVFDSRGDIDLENAEYSGLGFAVGSTLEVIIPRLHKQWSIYNELLWKSYKVEGEYVKYVSSDNYTRSNYEIGVSGVGLNTMLRYKMAGHKVNPYINFGIANNFGFFTTNKKTVQKHFHSDYPEVEDKALNEFRKYEQAWVAGFGASYNNFRAELRLERGNGMSAYPMLKSTKNMIGLLVAYDFNK